MYFNFDDRQPDISGMDRAMSWREGVLLSLVFHLALTILLLVAPQLFPVGKPDASEVEAKMAAMRDAENQARRFVFVQPRAEFEARQKPKSLDQSDRDRVAQTPMPKPNQMNMQPFSRGNTPDRVDQPSPQAQADASKEPSAQGPLAPGPPGSKVQDDSILHGLTGPAPGPRSGANGTAGERLQEGLRNALRSAPSQVFDNSQGGGQYGSAIQFDTKGVEFGPWVRRFIAQIKRNWFIPYAAMAMKGHVSVTFVVHKDGHITELGIAGPCPIDAFNNSSFNAIATSNPTYPLPPEYPDEQCRFTVTFFYNETPPDR